MNYNTLNHNELSILDFNPLPININLKSLNNDKTSLFIHAKSIPSFHIYKVGKTFFPCEVPTLEFTPLKHVRLTLLA